MGDFLERYWQLAALLGVLAVLASLEAPAEHPAAKSDRRLVTNLGLGGLSLLLPAILPVGTLAAAGLAGEIGWAPLTAIGAGGAFLAVLAARSFAAYWLHRATHRYPLLWRFHAVHHADCAVDVTTSWRNHPLEVLLAGAVAAAVVFALGPPPGAVMAVDGVLLLGALFEHADIRLTPALSGKLELALATPRFHRIHHSDDRDHFDRNFGGLLTVWDRLFGTWKEPAAMVASFGVKGDLAAFDSLPAQLLRPFVRQRGVHADHTAEMH